MPYLTQEDRAKLDAMFVDFPLWVASTPGDLNYLFSKIIDKYFEEWGVSYTRINEVIGALACCQQEVYRRIAADYEDDKVTLNGDVFTKALNRRKEEEDNSSNSSNSDIHLRSKLEHYLTEQGTEELLNIPGIKSCTLRVSGSVSPDWSVTGVCYDQRMDQEYDVRYLGSTGKWLINDDLGVDHIAETLTDAIAMARGEK